MSLAEFFFWGSAAILAYMYFGYPLLLRIAAARRPPSSRPAAEGALPTITVLVTAYNEASRIDQRLENLLSLDYPADRLEVIVGSDGSLDDTAQLARRWASRGHVVVYTFGVRRGKPAMLNDLVPRAAGSIVVFADARQRFDRGALRALAARFADPRVGAVSGELVLTESGEPSAVGRGVGLYWRYEKHIRHLESRVDSVVGATGAIYAIRRALYAPIPDDTILDDVLIPMEIVRRGHRVVAEPGALAFDRVAADAADEFTRKARTLAGAFQLLTRHRWLLDPRVNRLWAQTLSHKALRLAAPGLLVALLCASVALSETTFYQATAFGQGLFYLAAAVGARGRARGRLWPVVSVPYAFCLLNLATVVGFWRFAVTGQPVTWRRRPGRPAEQAAWHPARGSRVRG